MTLQNVKKKSCEEIRSPCYGLRAVTSFKGRMGQLKAAASVLESSNRELPGAALDGMCVCALGQASEGAIVLMKALQSTCR